MLISPYGEICYLEGAACYAWWADVGSFSLNAQYTLSSDGNGFQSNTLVFRQETYCQNVIVQNHNIIIFYFISALPK